MSAVKLAKSGLITAVIVVGAFIIVAAILIARLEGVDVWSYDWSGIHWQSIYSNNELLKAQVATYAPLLSVLAIPAIYSLFILFLLRCHQSKSDTARKNYHETTFGSESAESNTVDNVLSQNESTQEIISAAINTKPDSGFGGTDSTSALITRLKKDLVITEQQLNSAQSVKSQFLANMSHELRTPMNGILGMTELLMGSALDQRQSRFADSVRRSAEALLAIINDLLDYSKMEAGDLFLENSAFNLREVVEDVCDLQADYAQRKGIELICHIDRSMNEAVVGDSNRVRQLLTNLVGNAIKFTKHGEVVVRVKQSSSTKASGSYQIDVVDTGMGITPEGQAKIFDSFTQADDSNSREFGGAGLGLFITNKLVTMMGGGITLRSRMNEGSHFTVLLDLKITDSSDANANLIGTLAGARALIVDDNETNRTILYHQLKSWGIEAVAVESGQLALEAIRAARNVGRQYDVAILDLHMPVMDGLELTRTIQADESLRDLPRMMLTSAALTMTPPELASIGVSQYISKPARQTQLYNALASIVPGRVGAPLKVVNGLDEFLYEKLGGHVLLAEDNLINQEVAFSMLENIGCTVEVVSNGRAALEACENQYFDVIFMDCEMPIISGLEATQILREGDSPNKQTPVVALTANVMSGDRDQCLNSGMNDYISKPVKQGELYSSMKEWSANKDENARAKAAEIRAVEEQVVAEVSERVHGVDDTPESTPQPSNVVPIKEVQPVEISLLELHSTDDKGDATVENIADASTVVTTESMSSFAEEQVVEDRPVEGSPVVEVEASVESLTNNSVTVNEKSIDNIRRLQRKGKPDLVTKVLRAYLEKSPEIITEITEGFEAGDRIRVKEAAHSMKSSSAYVGADSISESCRQIELAADKDSLMELQSIIKELPANYDSIVELLSGYLEHAA